MMAKPMIMRKLEVCRVKTGLLSPLAYSGSGGLVGFPSYIDDGLRETIKPT